MLCDSSLLIKLLLSSSLGFVAKKKGVGVEEKFCWLRIVFTSIKKKRNFHVSCSNEFALDRSSVCSFILTTLMLFLNKSWWV